MYSVLTALSTYVISYLEIGYVHIPMIEDYTKRRKKYSVKVTNVQVYNQNKENVIKEIYDKIIKTISE